MWMWCILSVWFELSHNYSGNLSTRDKFSLGTSLQGTSWGQEAVLFSEVTNVLSLWEAVLFSEVTNVLSLWEVAVFRGCPLLRGNKCTITMGSGEAVLFSEVTNVLSLWEVAVFRGCPLLRGNKIMYYHYGKWGGCPLLRGNKCTITMGSGGLCSEAVLFSEVTTAMGSGGPLFRGCPLLRGNKCTITMGSGGLCSEAVLFSGGPLSVLQSNLIPPLIATRFTAYDFMANWTRNSLWLIST